MIANLLGKTTQMIHAENAETPKTIQDIVGSCKILAPTKYFPRYDQVEKYLTSKTCKITWFK